MNGWKTDLLRNRNGTHFRKKDRKDRAGRRLPGPPRWWRIMVWEEGTSGPDISSCERSSKSQWGPR